jgi:DNA-binding CsgD family transcriptional regulator
VARGETTSDAVLTLADEVRALMLAGDPRVRLLGSRDDVPAVIDEFSTRPQRRAWNMQWSLGSKSLCEHPRANATSREFGTDLRLVAPLRALQRRPLNVHIETPLRVGAVPYPMLVVDERAFLAGPLGTALADTFWAVEDPVLVERAARAFLAVWDAAVPLEQSGAPPPLPPRTLQVALRLVDGLTDKEIAADLGVSERTVSGEVKRVVEWAGARSRGHAVALLVGAA